MSQTNYLQWLSSSTKTAWWHDSGDPAELESAIRNGAVGVTTNPVLCARALDANRAYWREDIRRALDSHQSPTEKAEALMRIVVTHAAKQVEPSFRRTSGKHGYACAQVDPSAAGNREAMLAQAKRYHAWAPNIAIKLPATLAGLDVMEQCCSEGMTVTVTVSFTVAQVWSIAQRYQKVLERNRKSGRETGRCFAVIMIGRLDDYLREVFADNRAPVSEEELRMAGLSVVKHAYRLYQESSLEAVLLVAAMRGNYHMTELSGGDLILSIHPSYQKSLFDASVDRTEKIDEPIPEAALESLSRQPEFRKAYDPSAMSEKELIAFGLTQRTLSQFVETGWRPLEQFRP
ncbi:MAG TPA: transaldolase family protein [Spirochaetia bacterium]|nr:transaldolase family protein [Spirochaetia bacterium]